MSSSKLPNTPTLQLGFELEGFFLNAATRYRYDISYASEYETQRRVERQLKEAGFQVNVDSESLDAYPPLDNEEAAEDQWASSEIRTAPMLWGAAEEHFENLLATLVLLDRADHFKTTSGCGLHINVSVKELHGNFDGFDESGIWRDYDDSTEETRLFYAHLLCSYPETRALTRFRRNGNSYCYPVTHSEMKHKNARNIYVPDDHYNAVSNRGNRIEFRCFGNNRYHQRTNALRTSLREIYNACQEAYAYTKADLEKAAAKDEQRLARAA